MKLDVAHLVHQDFARELDGHHVAVYADDVSRILYFRHNYPCDSNAMKSEGSVHFKTALPVMAA